MFNNKITIFIYLNILSRRQNKYSSVNDTNDNIFHIQVNEKSFCKYSQALISPKDKSPKSNAIAMKIERWIELRAVWICK